MDDISIPDDITVISKTSGETLTPEDKFTFKETLPLAGFLGADATKDQSKLSEIADFIRDGKKEFSDIDLLNAVRGIETRLGLPMLGESRLTKVYQYIVLQRQAKTIDDRLKDLMR